MIYEGKAAQFRNLDKTKQLLGCFLWEIVAENEDAVQHIGDPLSRAYNYMGSAGAWWIHEPAPNPVMRAQLFGQVGKTEIGCVICTVEIITDLTIVPPGKLIREPLEFMVTRMLEYDPNAVSKRITITVGGRAFRA